ncbi:MAG TPA: glycosyltransferase family 2 protein [Puia sp.]|nr:glycosyltransferase family 2 protein [Puia sp.]
MLTTRETPPKPPEYGNGSRVFKPRFVPGTTKVSAVLITCNESRNIRRTLSKLYWCDEIIVVDSYSTDDTVAICEEFGCRVFLKTFEGYGAQKRYAVLKANNDWVLCIDADEVLSDALIVEIRAELDSNPPRKAYQLPMNLVFLDKEFRYGKESMRYFLRLFNRQAGNFNEGLVHEKIEVKGEVGRLKNKILHYSYDDIHHWHEKCGGYTTLGAKGAVREGRTRSVLSVVLALPFYFIRYYFFNLNFLNGLQGFYWSAFSAYAHFMKYVKIRELYAGRS